MTRNSLRCAACASLLAVAACARHPEAAAMAQAVRVETVSAEGDAAHLTKYSGVAQPDSQVPLAFRVPGYVTQLMQVRGSDGRMRALAEGDRVKRGDVLVRIRNAEYLDKVAQATSQAAAARAGAEKARSDWERANRLFASQSITRPEFEGAKAQHDATAAQLRAAEAVLREANVALRDTALVSPLDGDIVKKAVEPGALVGSGSLAFAVADISSVKVIVGVPDVVLHTLSVGRSVVVTSDAFPGQRFEARVSRIASAADPATRNFDVEIAIPNPSRAWKPGMIAAVELSGRGQASPPLLPFASIVEAPGRAGGFAVMLVDEREHPLRAHLRPVELGEVVGNRVIVVRGLSPGEKVVTSGASLLSDGERVEIVP